MNPASSARTHSHAWTQFLRVVLSLIAMGGVAHANGGDSSMRKRALGVTLDLLPIVLSATAGHVGASGQLWYGAGPLRFRAVAARLALPDWLAARDGFVDLRTNVGALLVDYTFGEHFDEFWIGSGFEYWRNEMHHQRAPRRDIGWSSALWTVGGGYTWIVARGFYLEPWLAAHVALNDASPSVAGDHYTPRRVQAEASLKLGYVFAL